MAGSTITTTISKEVVLGNGVYLSPLTLSSAARINAPAPLTSFQGAAAIYVNVSGASINNHGAIVAAIPATDSYTAPAILAVSTLNLANYGSISGQSGIYLEGGGTVTNSGTISGFEALGESGYGVSLGNGVLNNLGTIYGRQYGVADSNLNMVTNSGQITGETAGIRMDSAYLTQGGTLVNSGKIIGGGSGVTEVNASIRNSGTITGQTYGIRVSWGGAITNTGHISAGVDGVLLLNQQYQSQYDTTFTNSGTVQGGYFAVAINFANVSNAASGLISGTTFGAGVGGSGYLLNAGTVYGFDGGLIVESGGRATDAGTVRGNHLGIELFSESEATIAASGTVYGFDTAAANQAAYLVNAGTMVGNLYGVDVFSGGIVINSGGISSLREGVYLSTLSATSSPDFLDNTGTIYGAGLGVNLRNGTVYNFGVIDAAQIGISLVTGTSFNNAGYVYGLRYGVQLLGGTMVNSGSIGSGLNGIEINRGYLTNSGTIAGATDAIYGTSFSLIVDPGAVFRGNVVAKTGKLNLAGSTHATISGIGTSFSGFTTIDFDAGASWLVSGATAGLAAGQVIAGFEQGDTIVVTNFSMTSDSFVSGQGLVLHNSSASKTLAITGSFATANFNVTSSGAATTISLASSAPCFVAGTRILTARGAAPIEDLAVGDSVITLGGKDREIIWIGHRTIDLARHPRPEQVQPVCIAADALAEDVPERDLWVSPDHAIWIGGHLVPAQLLLNGLNIFRGAPARVTYYHLELAAHAILFAENTPAESYLETGNRHAFANAGAGMVLHPDFSALIRRQKSCAKLLQPGETLDEIRKANLQRFERARTRLSRTRLSRT